MQYPLKTEIYSNHQKATENASSYPLSPMQQGMLFHSLSEQQSAVDVEQAICTIYQELDLSAFASSWQIVVDRHPILRTSFDWQGAIDPVQTIHPQITIPISQQDWRHWSAIEQQEKLKAYLLTDRQRGFQLSVAPLMRLVLLQVALGEYKLIWTFHNILLDSRSRGNVLSEVFAVYQSLCKGEDLHLQQPRPFRDYIEWLKQQDLVLAEAFWKGAIAHFTAPTPLVVERASGSYQQQIASAEQVRRLSPNLTAKLYSLAEKQKLTLQTLLQGAWAGLLLRYSGEKEVIFGCTRECREWADPDGEAMVGQFLNTQPVRARLSEQKHLLEWLHEIQQQWTVAAEYSYAPLTLVQQCSALPHGTPLFESILVFENSSVNSAAFGMLFDEWQVCQQSSYPLTVYVSEGPELTVKIEYDRDRASESAIARMLGHLEMLLAGIAENPEQRLHELPLLTEPERHQLLFEWNQTQLDYPENKCIHELFEAQVFKTPDAVALKFENEQLTYSQLNQKVNQLAHYLRSLGVGPEVLVGLYVARSLEMVVGLLGILKAGGAYVPLDPAYPKDRIAYVLEDAKASVLLTQTSLLDNLPDIEAQVVCPEGDWARIARESPDNPKAIATPDNLAYVIYTSGSTGKPKGVQILHRAAVNFLTSMSLQPGMTSEDVVLAVSTISFDISVLEIFLTLVVGATCVVVSRAVASDGAMLAEMLDKSGATIAQATPATWRMLLLAGWGGNQKLKILCGGEAITRELANQLLSRSASLWNVYGPTETTVWATACPVEATEGAVLISGAIANSQFYILDDHLQPVPIGVPGELHIGGDGLARGYANRPDLTAEKFIPNPFGNTEARSQKPEFLSANGRQNSEEENFVSNWRQNSASRLYKTGDKARYLPDGKIEFLGRIDFQVKIRGFRIELGEIESLLDSHTSVQQAVVVARELQPSDMRLIAYIVPTQGHSLTASELRSFLKNQLPDYMVPSAFMMLDALPLTPNGKVNRKALPAIDLESSGRDATKAAPRDSIELLLTKIWQEILGVQSVGVKDNFLELGGHSLLAMRLVSQLQKQFGKNLPLTAIFQAPTVEQLANILRSEGWSSPTESLMVIQPGTSKPALFCIHVLGKGLSYYRPWAHHLGSDQPLYGLAFETMEGTPSPFNRVEDLASYYIKEMQVLQPQGPYYLSGVSFGGLVVFEMAQQLVEAGEQVALLVLFDTISPTIRRELSRGDRIGGHWNNLLKFGPIYLVQKVMSQVDKVKSRLQKILYKYYKLLGRPLPESLRYVSVIDSNQQAANLYFPRVYPGKVTLFQAKNPNPQTAEVGAYLDRTLGWAPLAAGGLEIHEVPGDHFSMLETPNCLVLAEKLKACLEKQQNSYSGNG